MTKEKLMKHQAYLNLLQNRKSSPVPEKHKNHPVEFFRFLDKEIKMVTSQIEAGKLDIGSGK